MKAAANDQPIPEGWALDADGQPTTDAKAALRTSSYGRSQRSCFSPDDRSAGGCIEGAHFAYEASSFLDAEGKPPHSGH